MNYQTNVCNSRIAQDYSRLCAVRSKKCPRRREGKVEGADSLPQMVMVAGLVIGVNPLALRDRPKSDGFVACLPDGLDVPAHAFDGVAGGQGQRGTGDDEGQDDVAAHWQIPLGFWRRQAGSGMQSRRWLGLIGGSAINVLTL